MNMPSVPKADIIAVAQAGVAAAVAFGAPLSGDQQKSLLALATVIATILVTADVKRRGNRAHNADKIAAATKIADEPQSATSTPTFDVRTDDVKPIVIKKQPAAKKKRD